MRVDSFNGEVAYAEQHRAFALGGQNYVYASLLCQ